MNARTQTRSARGPLPVKWLALLGLLLLAGCGRQKAATDGEHADGHADEAAHAAERGSHGGRLFEGDGVRLELQIFEQDVPPEYRAYLTDDKGQPLDPRGATLSVALDRFAGRRDSLLFSHKGDHLRSVGTVDEPHSFLARIHLDREGRRQTWSYEQEEGRVELSPEAVAAGGIETATASARRIDVRIETTGEIRLNADRVVQARPRFAGVIQRLPRQLGDRVRAGELLAVVHSNESLADYEIVAPLAGTIVARGAALGEAVNQESILFTIADLSSVWADFALYPQLATRVRTGQKVTIRAEGPPPQQTEGRVKYVGPLLEQDTRISYGRVVLANPNGRWAPGLFVTAAITVETVPAALAVPEMAIVRTTRGPAVFRADGTTFELQPVETGRTDGEWTEILSGLAAGDRYVTRNAFLLKAELGKSEATHDH